jgi:major membrane immunogen (membrane-anchored lipoprotein)
MRIAFVIAATLLLTACQSSSDKRAATIKGACDSFVAPVNVVQGKTRTDQRWVDGQIESGVSACGWRRPRA